MRERAVYERPRLDEERMPQTGARTHPGVVLRANLKSTSHRYHVFEVGSVWELTKETTHLPLSCLQDGCWS